MTKEEFLTEMQDVLQTEDTLTAETVLSDLAEWDSLSMMATMAFFDKNFGVKIGLKDFKEIETMSDLITKAGL
jgi:Phosphopantetheine attachment site.